jgi:hypothetical protein
MKHFIFSVAVARTWQIETCNKGDSGGQNGRRKSITRVKRLDCTPAGGKRKFEHPACLMPAHPSNRRTCGPCLVPESGRPTRNCVLQCFGRNTVARFVFSAKKCLKID